MKKITNDGKDGTVYPRNLDEIMMVLSLPQNVDGLDFLKITIWIPLENFTLLYRGKSISNQMREREREGKKERKKIRY